MIFIRSFFSYFSIRVDFYFLIKKRPKFYDHIINIWMEIINFFIILAEAIFSYLLSSRKKSANSQQQIANSKKKSSTKIKQNFDHRFSRSHARSPFTTILSGPYYSRSDRDDYLRG